jgi:uncharacterized membrane protein YqgA involved in biofilm formation
VPVFELATWSLAGCAVGAFLAGVVLYVSGRRWSAKSVDHMRRQMFGAHLARMGGLLLLFTGMARFLDVHTAAEVRLLAAILLLGLFYVLLSTINQWGRSDSSGRTTPPPSRR